MGTPPVPPQGQAGHWENMELYCFFLSGIRSKNMVGTRRQKVLVFSVERGGVEKGQEAWKDEWASEMGGNASAGAH